MSTLNLGNSPILKPMETGTCTWENNIIKITGTWYKKDNVVDMQFAYSLKAALSSGQNSGFITPTGLPTSLCPVSRREYPTLDGPYACAVVFETDGSAEFISYGSFQSGFSARFNTCYLVND